MTLDELKADGNWAQVFADENAGNVSKDTEAVGDCPVDPPPTRDAVVEIIASRDGENDEDSWFGVFRLDDGRFLFAEGGCDYTGWD